jgi:pentose-5-phosphate-3-epimerase
MSARLFYGSRLSDAQPRTDFVRLGEQVAQAERAGANRVLVDVIDGHFVPTACVPP